MHIDSEDKNSYIVYLVIRDFDCSPEELTRQLEIQPTETLKKGEYRMVGKKNPTKMLNKINYWKFAPNVSEDVSIERQFKILLEKLKPFKENFIKVSKKYTLRITCAAYYYEINPGINLSPEILEEIAQLHAEIRFDLYFLGGASALPQFV